MRTAAISLPGIEKADFHLARYYLLLQPGKGQLGVIGDDLLSQFTVQLTDSTAFLSAETCQPEALIARGFTPVAQNGFFSSDPSKGGARLPNVPVVFLRLGDVRVWAQIDTGYEDFVYSRSIDINQALFDRLVGNGAKLDRVEDIDIWTCDGREHWPVYRVKDRLLSIENEQGRQIVETNDFHLIVKSANTCGGIADMPEPAAQLGASFLGLFGDVIFDPRNTIVWLGGGLGSRRTAAVSEPFARRSSRAARRPPPEAAHAPLRRCPPSRASSPAANARGPQSPLWSGCGAG